MKHILFVDDEQHLLDGIRRALRRKRSVWRIAIANSGREALEMLGQEHFDAIVSDMMMPAMDGAELLSRVADTYPDVLRVILSGQSDDERNVLAVDVAHQFIARPCDIERLSRVLEHSFALRHALANDSLEKLVSGIKSLPSLPSAYVEIEECLRSGTSSTKDIGKIISVDPAMSAKLLKLVNSAFFGLGRTCSNPTDAAVLLGVDTLKTLVLSVGIFSQFNPALEKDSGMNLERYQQSCLQVGLLAKKIAAAEGQERSLQDTSQLAGMLHGLGYLVLATNLPDSYRLINDTAAKEQTSPHIATQKVLGTSQDNISAYLLSLWGFDDSVVDAVAYLHRPGEHPAQHFTPLTAVHIAHQLIHAGQGESVDRQYLDRLGLADHQSTYAQLLDDLNSKAA